MKKNVFISAVAIPNTAAAASCGLRPVAQRPGRDKDQHDGGAGDTQPGHRLRGDLIEQQRGDRGARVLGDRREDEQRLGCRCVEERLGEELRVRRADVLPQGLEAEPAGEVEAGLFAV